MEMVFNQADLSDHVPDGLGLVGVEKGGGGDGLLLHLLIILLLLLLNGSLEKNQFCHIVSKECIKF